MIRLLFAAVVVSGCLLCARADAEDLLIIANPSVPAETPVTLRQIAAIYLLRVTTWPDGAHIVPVNREADSATRMKFASLVLRQDDDDLAAYWNEMHYRGKLPPVVQESEQAMLAFVQHVPGSIGYITASTAPVNVKVLAHVH